MILRQILQILVLLHAIQGAFSLRILLEEVNSAQTSANHAPLESGVVTRDDNKVFTSTTTAVKKESSHGKHGETMDATNKDSSATTVSTASTKEWANLVGKKMNAVRVKKSHHKYEQPSLTADYRRPCTHPGVHVNSVKEDLFPGDSGLVGKCEDKRHINKIVMRKLHAEPTKKLLRGAPFKHVTRSQEGKSASQTLYDLVKYKAKKVDLDRMMDMDYGKVRRRRPIHN